MRIVIIDDEFLIIKAMSTSLSHAGHQVIGTAEDVTKALSLIDGSEPEIAIVDLNLKGASAEPIVKRLADRNIPTLVMTGFCESQRPDWAFPCLEKPFSSEELFKALAAAAA